jgi:hypothetical protein
VPGPHLPLYLLGARMTAIHPLVPLFERQALGIAVFSYDGRLYWGFNADHDEVPDLHELVRMVDREFAALATAAGVSPAAKAGGSPAGNVSNGAASVEGGPKSARSPGATLRALNTRA